MPAMAQMTVPPEQEAAHSMTKVFGAAGQDLSGFHPYGTKARKLGAGLLVTLAWSSCNLPSALNSVVTTVELNRTVMQPGDELQITVHATNLGISAVTMSESCALGYRIFAPDGSIVAPGPNVACAAYAKRLRIDQGETYTRTFSWRAIRWWESFDAHEVPGEYSVVGAVTANGGFRGASLPRSVRLLAEANTSQ
jgi:hypothetical protein